MTKIFVFAVTICFYCSGLVAQEESSFINSSRTLKKGTIILNNGSVIIYSNLSSEKDSVFFKNSELSQDKLSLSNIEQITRAKSKPGSDVLLGGVIGIVSGALVGTLIYPNRNAGEWLTDKINGEDEGQSIRKEALPIIAIGTVSGIAIGALVGLLKKKEKVVYQKHKKIDVFPELTSFPNQDMGLMLTVKIQLK